MGHRRLFFFWQEAVEPSAAPPVEAARLISPFPAAVRQFAKSARTGMHIATNLRGAVPGFNAARRWQTLS